MKKARIVAILVLVALLTMPLVAAAMSALTDLP